jgi:hypothetical protein
VHKPSKPVLHISDFAGNFFIAKYVAIKKLQIIKTVPQSPRQVYFGECHLIKQPYGCWRGRQHQQSSVVLTGLPAKAGWYKPQSSLLSDV